MIVREELIRINPKVRRSTFARFYGLGLAFSQPPWHMTCYSLDTYEIIAGLVLIGLGFAMGDSIFLGNFGVLSLFFDGLGLFWIGQGAYQLWRDRQAQDN